MSIILFLLYYRIINWVAILVVQFNSKHKKISSHQIWWHSTLNLYTNIINLVFVFWIFCIWKVSTFLNTFSKELGYLSPSHQKSNYFLQEFLKIFVNICICSSHQGFMIYIRYLSTKCQFMYLHMVWSAVCVCITEEWRNVLSPHTALWHRCCF